MILVCDIGNSFIKSAIFKNDKVTNYIVKKDFSAILKQIQDKNINRVVISSVVPAKLKLLLKELTSFNSIRPVVINKNLNFNLSIKYVTSQTLGIDRICSAEGALYLANTANNLRRLSNSDFILAIDCGTATTINIVEYPNSFLGGLIAPGLDMMFSALNAQTAQLPLLTAKSYRTFIGDSTKTSIASGVINATVGMIHESITLLKPRPKNIFITGGNAEYIIPHLKIDAKYEKALVLYGIKAIYDKNNQIT